MIGHRVEVQGIKPERGGSSVCLTHTAASVFLHTCIVAHKVSTSTLAHKVSTRFASTLAQIFQANSFSQNPDQIERTASSWKSGALQSLLGSASTCGKSAIDIAI